MPKIKKVSVVSIESVKIKSAKLQKHWESVDLKDNLFFVHILFLLMGLMHFLPFTFFITANAYWMDKFRNVSADSMDATQRTSLQSHFTSSVSMTNSISNSAFVVVSALVGHKVKARTRTLSGLAIMIMGFAMTTFFVAINTDSWQTLFFCVTLGILVIINAANATLQIAVLAFLAKFPPYYMNIYLFGEGCAAVFNALLQILTLAVGTSTTTSALIYFVLGTVIMGLTFFLFYFTKHNKLFMYYVEHSEEDITRDMLSYSEFKGVLKLIWPCILMYFFYDITNLPKTPVTALVVSEDYGSGNAWNDVYFVPVITFLYADLCTLLGRVASSATKTVNSNLMVIFSFSRIFVLVPLLLLCNAQPRKHLPVIFGYDWEYIVIQGCFSFSNGYLFNVVFLGVSRFMEPEKVADGYLVLMCSICLLGSCLSPLGAFSVDLL